MFRQLCGLERAMSPLCWCWVKSVLGAWLPPSQGWEDVPGQRLENTMKPVTEAVSVGVEIYFAKVEDVPRRTTQATVGSVVCTFFQKGFWALQYLQRKENRRG